MQPWSETETDKALQWRGRGRPWRRPPGRTTSMSTPVNTSASPDVDECLEQLDECHYNQLCENTPGGHHCGCPRGYRQQGHGLPCLGKGDSQNLFWVLGLTQFWLRTRSVYGMVSLRVTEAVAKASHQTVHRDTSAQQKGRRGRPGQDLREARGRMDDCH